jgi:peptidoglycan/xylan/chitin deacetylase (PgdA/CDA1 family)
MLDELTFAAQQAEITESKRMLDHQLGQPVTSFCYPAGHFNADSLRIVQAVGYEQAVVTPWKADLICAGRFTLKRVGIYQHDSLLSFCFKVSPLFEWVRTLRGRLGRS